VGPAAVFDIGTKAEINWDPASQRPAPTIIAADTVNARLLLGDDAGKVYFGKVERNMLRPVAADKPPVILGDAAVSALAVSRDGRLAAAGFANGQVFGSVNDGVAHLLTDKLVGPVRQLSTSSGYGDPDNRQGPLVVAAQSTPDRVIVQDMESTENRRTVAGPNLAPLAEVSPFAVSALTAVRSTAFLSCLTTSENRQISLDGHTGEITAAAFDPSSRFVVTASRDGTARVWPLRLDETPRCLDLVDATTALAADEPSANWVDTLLAQGRRFAGRNFTASEWKKAFGSEPWHETFPGLGRAPSSEP
jgi:hypothetical protein